jgi:hypothetical protein
MRKVALEEMSPCQPPLETPKCPASRAAGWSIKPRSLVCAAAFFTAALHFWLPSVAIHFVRGGDYGVFDMLLTSILCPAAASIAFAVLCLLPWDGSLARKASMFLLGIWVWGLPSMMVAATFSGRGLHGFGLSDVGLFVFAWACFVVSTPMMAIYDGSLLALLVTTLVLTVIMIGG